jgi:hypothetical protein
MQVFGCFGYGGTAVDGSAIQTTSLAPLRQGMSPTSNLLIPAAARTRLPEGVRQALESGILILCRTTETEMDWAILRNTITAMEHRLLPFVARTRPPQGWPYEEENVIRNAAQLCAWWYTVQWPRPDKVALLLSYVSLAM